MFLHCCSLPMDRASCLAGSSPFRWKRPCGRLGSLSGYQLAWFYYSYSHVYAVLLGAIQLAGGSLLLFRKTALLGAALMLPVMTNILMINVFFHIAWGALGTSALILASMLAVLGRQRHALFGVFWSHQASEPANSRCYCRIAAALVVLLVITLMGLASWLTTGSKISK